MSPTEDRMGLDVDTGAGYDTSTATGNPYDPPRRLPDEPLMQKLECAHERRLQAEQERSNHAAAAAAARLERDAAIKQLEDEKPGVAKLITQLEVQGARIDELSALLVQAREALEEIYGVAERHYGPFTAGEMSNALYRIKVAAREALARSSGAPS